jgi:tetratricopeptide (TPR) repeat protein
LLLWETLAALKHTEPLSSNLFALGAFLGPQPFYTSALLEGLTHLPEPLQNGLGNRGVLPNALAILGHAGLARLGDAAFAIAPVLQERFVSLCPIEKKEGWCNAAVRFAANLFPFKEEHSQFDLQCSRLVGHASAVATWAEQIGCSLEDAGRLLNQLGLYLRACGQRDEAIKYYLHAIACGEAIDGVDHPKVAVRINNLGVVYRETGRLDDAREAFRRAIRIIKDAYGPADHMLAMAVRNLVAVAKDSEDEKEMERSYRRALRIYADSLGQAHPYVHECLYSLGHILRKHDKIKDAKRCFKEALRCALLCDPVDEDAVALYSRNLGRLLLRAGEMGAALEHLETSVALQRKLNDPSSSGLAENLYELGHAYRLEKRFPEARKCLEEALQIGRASAEDGNLQIRILNQLARVMRGQGDAADAATCYTHICRLQEESGGAENPELIGSLIELGDALEQIDSLNDAEQCFARALLLEKKLATGNPSTGMLHYRIGVIKRTLGEYENALESFKTAMSDDTREHGGRHPDVARDLLGIGLVYRDMGDSSRAVGNLMRALSIYEEQLGRYHAQTIEARNTLEALGNGDAY